MDATDSIDVAELAERSRETGNEGYSLLPSKTRRLHAKGSAARLLVTSDLTSNEPVTDAEIRLILAVLGDTLSQILTSSPVPCSAPTATSDV